MDANFASLAGETLKRIEGAVPDSEQVTIVTESRRKIVLSCDQNRCENVFRDPRVGDVVASEFGGTWKVIAVTAEGVMCISDMKGVFGWHRNDWAAYSGRWTVKHLAPEGGAK